MKQTNFFNISVPELGDRPDITQVSNAISNLEDALAGTMEYMNASVNNKVLTLTSATRKTKRTGYHTGLTCVFTSGVKIDIGGITSVVVDNLTAKPAELKFIIDADDSAIVVFDGTKFAFKHAPMPRSNAIDSSSEHFIATSRAVKTLNDNKAEKTVQVIAGNGLTGGGDLTSNKTINVVSADAGIVVNADNIKLNVVNAINSTDAIRPATANAVKTAYDKGVEGLNKANEAVSLANSNNTAMDNKKVNRAGDTMTGNLVLNGFNPIIRIPNVTDGHARGLEIFSSDGANRLAGIGYLGSASNVLWLGGGFGENWYQEATGLKYNKSTIKYNNNPIYHTGNKPSKADVGLSSVPNYPATSSVSDTSNEKFATAGAVKQAYDRASSGINEANTKVSKAGDTMTGTLTATNFVATQQHGLRFANLGGTTGGYIGSAPSVGIGFVNVKGNVWNFNVKDNGDGNFVGSVTATKFLGPLQGNADTSTKLATARQINGTNFDGTGNITTANWGTARNITIGNTAKSVNGSGNVSWTIGEMGVSENKIWTAVLQKGKWAKVCELKPYSLGSSADIAINYTRGSVVCNDTIKVVCGHSGKKHITVHGGGYTKNKYRLTGGPDNFFLEVMDGGGDAVGTAQNARCSANNINCTLNPVTTFTEGLSTDTSAGLQVIEGMSTTGAIKTEGDITVLTDKRVYHQGFKPSNADVGLGNVSNWSATGAVNDASDTKYATAGGVKKAYDRGTEAINKANSVDSAKVSKAGDTMTGKLVTPDIEVKTAGGKGAKFGSSTHKALVGVSSNVGEYLFGGNKSGADSFEDFIRIGNGKFKYNIPGAEYDIYHTGKKPTANDVGAIQKNTTNGTPIASYYLSTGTSSTRTKIRLPFKTNAGKMVVFTIRVYQSYMHFDIKVSGYLYSSTNQWHSPNATMISGSTSIEVKLGRDAGGYAYVSIAGGDYRGVAVIDVVGGYSTADWNSGWEITATNDMPDVAYTATIYPPFSKHNLPTAADVGLGNVPNTKHTTGIEGNTVAVRDSAGDLQCRLLRSNYQDQSTMNGAIAFRTNNSSDNYTRYCNSNTAVRNWLSTYSRAETDDKYYGSHKKPMIGKRESIWSGNITTGNFTMTKPYTDFDYLLILASPDNDDSFSWNLIYKEELDLIRNSYSNKICLTGTDWFWTAGISSDNKTFVVHRENCRIRMVIGGKV